MWYYIITKGKEISKNGICNLDRWYSAWLRDWNGGGQIMNTYITLFILLGGMIYLLCWLVKQMMDHNYYIEKKIEKPLDNRNKWWYN